MQGSWFCAHICAATFAQFFHPDTIESSPQPSTQDPYIRLWCLATVIKMFSVSIAADWRSYMC